ncbi:hypothetical protein L1077_04940 [Pseudoalteromonas luteoviolacea]|uniref:hypothetical protein n=1 Tax=Pseudoalteromonas luteoviolacea TaxID=43657 RepID=UPI001F372A93|nr:hypothetical protein [Pseudoalteromonas luteoviolacea]MCF6438776.1 hypothetical protein [Pseudoalteromonas luteoviolacea]
MLINAIALVSALASSSYQANNVFTIEDYEERARLDSQVRNRCTSIPVSYSDVKVRINWAYNQGLITERASYWGKAYAYYPVIDMFSHQITAICKGG